MMNDFIIYALVIILGVVSIRYGKQNNKKQITYAGIAIVALSVVVPILAFTAGVIIGIKT